MYELQRIFEAKLNVDKKSKQILAKIESFSKGNFKCPNHEVELPKSEQVINFVFYGPIVAIATPFVLPLYFKEVSQQSDLRKVRLGMSETDIDQIFKGGSDLWLSHKLHHDSFILKRMTRAYTDHSLSFVYENKKLVGYVWSSWHNTGDPKYLVP